MNEGTAVTTNVIGLVLDRMKKLQDDVNGIEDKDQVKGKVVDFIVDMMEIGVLHPEECENIASRYFDLQWDKLQKGMPATASEHDFSWVFDELDDAQVDKLRAVGFLD